MSLYISLSINKDLEPFWSVNRVDFDFSATLQGNPIVPETVVRVGWKLEHISEAVGFFFNVHVSLPPV
jgi:hypothetical protein